MEFHRDSAYRAFYRGHQVDWTRADLEEFFIHFHWSAGEAIGLTGKYGHEHKCEESGHVVNKEFPHFANVARSKAGLLLRSIYDVIAATRESSDEEQPNLFPGDVIVSASPATGNNHAILILEICQQFRLMGISSLTMYWILSKARRGVWS